MHHSILPPGLDSFHQTQIAFSVFLESDGSYSASPAEGMIFRLRQKVAEFSQLNWQEFWKIIPEPLLS